MSTAHKVIKTGTEARDALVRGADFLANAVKRTLGPFGENFLLEKGNKITNDGDTVARELELKDEIEQRGLAHLRSATIEANQQLGDGSTTTTIFAQAILKEAVKLLGSSRTVMGKKKPAEVLAQIEKERKEVTDKLMAMAKPITTEQELIESARVSVGDEELAKLIGSAQFKLGPEGVLISEESNDLVSSVEFVSGLYLDNGFSSSLAINDLENDALVLKDTHVLLTNYTFQSLAPILPIMEQLAKAGVRQFIIIARAFSEEAIRHCLENGKKGFGVFPVNAPYTNQNEILKDLVAVVGGRYISTEESELDAIQLSDIGFTTNFIAKRFTASIAGTADEKSKQRIAKRIDELKKMQKASSSDFEKKNLAIRIAQLGAGFGIVKVGAPSQSEMKYKKDKVEDAVNAVRLSYQEGVVPGAGLAPKQIAEGMDDSAILKRPLLAIYEQIMFSAPEGFVIEEWVKDPVKVLRVALEKACSVAGRLATAGGATATERAKPKYVEEVVK